MRVLGESYMAFMVYLEGMHWLFLYAFSALKALISPSLKVVVSKLWQIQGTRFCVVKHFTINFWEKQNCSGLEFEYGLSGLMWNIGFYLRHWGHHKDQRGSCLRENSLTFLRIRHISIWKKKNFTKLQNENSTWPSPTFSWFLVLHLPLKVGEQIIHYMIGIGGAGESQTKQTISQGECFRIYQQARFRWPNWKSKAHRGGNVCTNPLGRYQPEYWKGFTQPSTRERKIDDVLWWRLISMNVGCTIAEIYVKYIKEKKDICWG